MGAPRGHWEFEGKLMTADGIKHRFAVKYSPRIIREALQAGAQDIDTLCMVCDMHITMSRKKAAQAGTAKRLAELEQLEWALPVHDYTPPDRAFMAWRGPCEGRLFGMVGVAG